MSFVFCGVIALLLAFYISRHRENEEKTLFFMLWGFFLIICGIPAVILKGIYIVSGAILVGGLTVDYIKNR